MRNHPLHLKIIQLLLLALFAASCNGQATLKQTQDISLVNEFSQQDKIVRTQGAPFAVVRCELLDQDGNIWFSIKGEGAYRYNGKTFTNFNTNNGLFDNNINCIIQDKSGNILLGTQRGICKYDGKTFTKYPIPDTLSISAMLEDKDGNLWFGTLGHGVFQYNGKEMSNFLNQNDYKFNLGIKTQFILDILQDKNGNIWFSSWNGGGVWRYDGKEFKNFVPSPNYYKSNQDKRNINQLQNTIAYTPKNSYATSPEFITDDMIFSMMEDKAGNIWFATRDHGACYFNGKIFTSFGKKEGFLSRGAYAILEDTKGNIWFTTEKDGVWLYNGSTIKNFTEKDGIINNAVLSILEDKDGNIWFGTKGFGLSRFDGKIFTTLSP